MSSFSENTKAGISFLNSSSLEIDHGFCKRTPDFKDKRIQSAERFCKAFEVEKLYLLKQVHGTDILQVDQQNFPEVEVVSNTLCYLRPDADGIFLLRQGISSDIAFGLYTADCLPIIICGEKAVSLVHAGWRGLVSGICKNALELHKQAGDAIRRIVIGPCAGVGCFEVQEDVASLVRSEGVIYEREGLLYLSLEDLAVKRFSDAGIQPEQIELSGICTISDSDFHSFRRDGKGYGLNLSFIIPTNENIGCNR